MFFPCFGSLVQEPYDGFERENAEIAQVSSFVFITSDGNNVTE